MSIGIRDLEYHSIYTNLFSPLILSICNTAIFVVSLYLWPNHRQRDQHGTILRRIISISGCTIISMYLVNLYAHQKHESKIFIQLVQSIGYDNFDIKNVLTPLILTCVVYTGSLFDEISTRRVTAYILGRQADKLVLARNLLIAPFLEEIVFRCINCTLLSSQYTFSSSALISGLLFGLAHMHSAIMQQVFKDMEKETLLESSIVFVYTTIFGIYAATFFLKTKSLWSSLLVHIFCNMMGVPSIRTFSNKLKFVTLIGVITWIILYQRYLTAD